MNLVIYHGGSCYDGFCAAWIIRNHFPQAEFVPANYGDTPPDVSGMDVVIVDFSYPRDVLVAMKAKAKSLVVLDHHATAQKELEGLDFCIFDMTKSGARLAWEFFGDKEAKSPWIVDYVEDHDLHLFALPRSQEVRASLRAMPLTWETFDKLAATKNLPGVFVESGAAILRYTEQLIEQHVKHAAEIEMAGHKVLCVNVSAAAIISEVGARLAIDRPFSVTWFAKGDGTHVFSLRSTLAGLDVSEVAKGFGGGGHLHAAGFSLTGFLVLGHEKVMPKSIQTEPARAVRKGGEIRHDVTVDLASMIHLGFNRVTQVENADGIASKNVELEYETILDRGTALMLAKNLRSRADGL